ncbi:ribonuclease P protein component [Chloroflexota bacterium]
MRSEQRLTKPKQYASVYKEGNSFTSDLLVMRALPNGLSLSRYGFSVSKRVGNAVRRNRIKRLLREILRTTQLKPSWDIVFIVRPTATDIKYAGMEESVNNLLTQAGLLDINEE